jgi:hypothetical protein
MADLDLSQFVTNFTNQLVSLMEQTMAVRVQVAVNGALGAPKRGPGRPPKNGFSLAAFTAAPKAKRPKQLCPVPGCKNPAAPVFGMVCAEHRSVPKAKIKEYRAKRRAAKAKAVKAKTTTRKAA